MAIIFLVSNMSALYFSIQSVPIKSVFRSDFTTCISIGALILTIAKGALLIFPIIFVFSLAIVWTSRLDDPVTFNPNSFIRTLLITVTGEPVSGTAFTGLSFIFITTSRLEYLDLARVGSVQS